MISQNRIKPYALLLKRNNKAIPRYIIFFLSICIFGLSFPIYGLHVFGFKLTFFRFGLLLLLLLTILFYKIRYKNSTSRILFFLFVLLGFFRLLSLLSSSNIQGGIQQIEWFFEGIFFILVNIVLSSHFKNYSNLYLKLLFYVGFLSISLMSIQFLLFIFNKTFMLPFSTSLFGFEENEFRPWTYPLYGGRVIGAFYEPNMAGSMCAFYLAAFIPFLFQKKMFFVKPRDLFIVLFIAAIALISTGSKQGLIALIITLVIVVFMASNKKKFVPLLVGIFIAIILSQIISSKYFIGNFISPETSLDRFFLARQAGDITGGRIEFILNSISNIDTETLLAGIGEGMAEHTAHNAFLIVLIENGIFALITLIIICVILFIGPFKKSPRFFYQYDNLKISSVCISSTWIILILINWAQLNVNISYLFLVIPIIYLNTSKPTKNPAIVESSNQLKLFNL